MSRLPFLALASVMIPGALTAAEPVAFDWFEYTGRDTAFEQPIAPGQFRNPILSGFYPDPSICRVGDDYYLINSTFAYFPGIPIFHSRDLVNWKQVGHVIHRPEQLPYDGLGVSRAIFAPAISYHDGTFYVVCTMVDAGGNFLVTAKDPAGPWSDPIWFDFEGIDPSLCFMEDGRAWMLNNGAPAETPRYDGHRAIWIQEFDIAAKKLVGPRQVLVNGGVDISKKPVWIEGPHLYQRGDWYYLCAAEGGTSENHSQVILRSKSPTGPFVPWEKNPILTQRDLDGSVPLAVTSTGHADLVIGPDGNWWSVFLACRPYGGKWYATGRETFLLPVTWTDDDWPVILPPGERVPYVVDAPRAASVNTTGTPLTGNFTWRDDFAASELSPLWIMLRTPKEPWWSVDTAASTVRLTPRAEKVSGNANPSYLARRVHHARFEAATALMIPAEPGVSAGLVVFQSETHHYFMGVRQSRDGAEVFLEKSAGKDSAAIVATTPLKQRMGAVKLHVKMHDERASFAFSTGPGAPTVLVPDADATILTTQASWGFVGATIGMHARVEK
ncbi:MAG: glycoside hydrolase family 43 protein [Opitutaceae bacterium]|nr:glycoside hydrolase family 43 protein [Opitutaceae bacterium]